MTASDETQPLVRRELTDGVLLLTWNRPERNNAWTIPLEDEYFSTLIEAAADPDVRVIVVTGAGRAFCPGLDMDVLSTRSQGDRIVEARYPMTTARLIPKPIIAAINGACAGIGFLQALCCDLRFAARGAKFTTAFARRGLPAESASSWMLPRLIGTGAALDLLLSARVITADEALSMRLVDRVYEPEALMAETMAYARDLAANCSPRSMASVKEQVYDDYDRSCEESRLEALQRVVDNARFPDFREGVASFVEKRPPAFPGVSRTVDVEREDVH